MERFHIVYIYISRGDGYAYSTVIENHYKLVIDLWCKYLGRVSYKEAIGRAVIDSLKEYFEMGLSEIPVILILPENRSTREMIESNEFIELIRPFNEVRVSLVKSWRYRRSVELARFCIKNRLERYPPSKFL